MGIDVPLIGDFHYNGHRLLTDYPACAEALSQVPHQPRQRRQGRQARPPVRADGRGRRRATTSRCASASTGAASTRSCWPQLMDENAKRAEPLRAAADHVPRASSPRRIESARRAEEIGLRGEQIILSCKMSRRAGPDQRLPRAGAALRLRAAPGPDRSRHGHQGHGGLDRRAGAAAAGRHRRHDPRLADAAAGRGAHAGGGDRARDPAVAGPARVQPERHRLPGLRPHHQHHLPGAGQADRRLPARADAGLARRAIPASRR